MKAIWLVMFISYQLSIAETYCPEKCSCIWYTGYTLNINCSGSEQKQVPYGLHPMVRVLDLSDNEITSYNHSSLLKIIEEIDLSNNKITEAHFGGSFKHLTSIDLSDNYITTLKLVDVENLQFLKKLNLSHNTKLHELSGLKSQSLKELYLSNCLIPFIEKDFLENVPSLRYLDISYNSFRSLNSVQSNSLEELDASHGQIETLTQLEVSNLPNLTKLNVSYNTGMKIDFSYENTCWDVKNLDLSNSNMIALGDLFPFCSLEVLNASLNKIQLIEVRTFFNNCQLHFINLSKNRISEIHSRAFFNTEKIKMMDLSYNKIQDLEFTLYLNKVEYLDLSRNEITTLTGLILKNVTNLNLSGNNIREIWFNFNENAPKIKKINLSRNKIKSVKRFLSSSINYIDLSYCEISTISLTAFEENVNLRQLNLVGNKLTTLSLKVIKKLDHLNDLSLAHNQWSCECKSKLFKELYEYLTVEKPITNIQTLMCARNNDTWRNSCVEVWHKEKEWKKTVYSLVISLAIALVVVGVIFFCKYFNDKKRLEEIERRTRERRRERELMERRLHNSNFLINYEPRPASIVFNVVEDEPALNRSSTPPPAYEAALLLPKLSEQQRQLAISNLSTVGVAGEERMLRAVETTDSIPSRTAIRRVPGITEIRHSF